ncbi:MAG TPA: GIY-YIG nuclease family protein [Terriglobia bacterium]|nr:GIY-YIG nuclease family protein [Terriglobia bacterium]
MPIAPLRLIKQCIEWRKFEKEEVKKVPKNTRGIYVLFKENTPKIYDVMYIGMAGADTAGINARLGRHLNSEAKNQCTHFSVFEVHDNIREEEIRELEGILRHIFRKDSRVNSMASQKGYDTLRREDVRRYAWSDWA